MPDEATRMGEAVQRGLETPCIDCGHPNGKHPARLENGSLIVKCQECECTFTLGGVCEA